MQDPGSPLLAFRQVGAGLGGGLTPALCVGPSPVKPKAGGQCPVVPAQGPSLPLLPADPGGRASSTSSRESSVLFHL